MENNNENFIHFYYEKTNVLSRAILKLRLQLVYNNKRGFMKEFMECL